MSQRKSISYCSYTRCLRSKFKNCAVFAVKLSVGICYRNFFCIAPAGISVIIGTIKILMNHESFSFIAAKNCKQTALNSNKTGGFLVLQGLVEVKGFKGSLMDPNGS